MPSKWQHPVDHNGDYIGLERWDMPQWADGTATHYQLYETVTEGTPRSPVMATPEQLAQWLVDHNASAFAGQTADYDAWLSVCQGQAACTAVLDGDQIVSGVAVMAAGEHKAS